jgi:hypothetical protein
MFYSDFAQPTVSTTADVAGTTANLTYNGVGGRVYFVWGSGGAQTDTAAQGMKMYALFTGTGIPGVVPNIPIGRWKSADLAGASVGSVSGDAAAMPVNWNAPANGVVTIDVRNATSSTAPLAQVGIIYGSGTFQSWEAQKCDPWNLRDVPTTVMTATPTSIATTTETGIGTVTIPADYPNVVGVTTLGVTNGVRVTAEEFFGTARYTATGAGQGVQFEPAQKWPFFGQQQAPVGTDIQEESFNPTQFWHPLNFKASVNSTIQSLITLRTAITNADSFQIFVALK